MKDILEHKNFIGKVHFSSEDSIFYGKIEGIDDLVIFEGKSVAELNKSFKEAVEDYVNLCAEAGKRPFKSFKGNFNIRIPPELHKMAFHKAVKKGIPLNKFVQKAITREVLQAD